MAKRIEASLLSIDHLSLSIGGNPILTDINLRVEPNEIVALVGESGSGKSVTAQAIMGLLPKKQTQIDNGQISFNDQNLLELSSTEWEQLRGNDLGVIFQEPQSSLNPSMRCGEQIEEVGRKHLSKNLSKKALKEKVLAALAQVQLPHPERIYAAYPHQLSGGQKQRIMIAMALFCAPKLLIADEPTTALDVLVQKDIIELIKSLQDEHQMSVLFISHDLSLVANLADRIAVMQAGKIVEYAPTKELFKHPQHPYTKGLLNTRPSKNKRLQALPTLKDFSQGDFIPQMVDKKERAQKHKSLYKQAPLLRVKQLEKSYLNPSLIGKKQAPTVALKDISFDLYPGETLGLVGASGCGKSTLAKALVFLDPANRGEVFWKGELIKKEQQQQIKQLSKDIQFIFQDPYAALHPLKTITAAIDEVLTVHTSFTPLERSERITALLTQVGLSAEFRERYPHQLSGGQRQRVVIARALAVEPKVLLCDESVAALDISVQAQVLNLLNHLKKELKLSFLFVSHDLNVVKHMADRIIVMHQGCIVEENEADTLYHNPQTAFSKALLAAVL
ncbi:MAG: ABC transporter ATP-binding protein [Flavobacteriaceae bacterium]|nr:ABC transporter ATP-binding protein [Flavobacteriaceae bacterium]